MRVTCFFLMSKKNAITFGIKKKPKTHVYEKNINTHLNLIPVLPASCATNLSERHVPSPLNGQQHPRP